MKKTVLKNKKKMIYDMISSREYVPMRAREMAVLLQIPKGRRKELEEVLEALKEEGIPFENDKFVPHITLIRKVSAKKPYQVHLPKADMTVTKVSLMKSEFRNGKTVYQEL